MLLPGVECDLIPAVTNAYVLPVKVPHRKDPKVWLAGSELFVRAERQGLSLIPPQLFLKKTLRQLVLTSNELTCIPEDVRLLTNLRELRVGFNRLQLLPQGICQLQHLEVLDAQHNQLQDVPSGLCRLVHLDVLNLDGNPLSPSLDGIWSSTAGEAAAAAAAGRPSSGKQAAAAVQERLKTQTRAVLQHLLDEQDAATILQVKQARLELLQQASTQQICKLLCVADMHSLQKCHEVATNASLDQGIQLQIEQVQAAVTAVQTAAQKIQLQQRQLVQQTLALSVASSGALEELRAAIKQFEQLCRPGRPSGGIYVDAHSLWRRLQRQQLERGWRCSGPQATPAGSEQADEMAAVSGQTDVDEMGGGSSVGPVRRFLTMQEYKRQQLQSAGADSYKDWLKKKQEQHQCEQQLAMESKQREAAGKQQRVNDRAAKAVTQCDREMAWPSHLGLQAFPPGTFRIPPQQLKAIRRAYQKPHNLTASEG